MDTAIRQLVSTVYDIQSSRIATGNRLVAYVMGYGEQAKERLAKEREALQEGKEFDKEKADKENQKVIAGITAEYRRIADVVAEHRISDKYISGTQYIKDVTTYRFAQLYMELLRSEEAATRILALEVEKHPMWDAFFKDVKGCGPLMAGICLAYFDIEKARWPSSIWKYAGLDVVYNEDTDAWEGRSKRHTEEREYITKEGNVGTRNSLTYNPFVKTKLAGVLTSCLLRSTSNGKYVKIRNDYMHRLQNRPDLKDHTKGHLNNMANRYMIKMFLRDMWKVWRELEGYDTGEPYEVAKLGMKPHAYNEATA